MHRSMFYFLKIKINPYIKFLSNPPGPPTQPGHKKASMIVPALLPFPI